VRWASPDSYEAGLRDGCVNGLSLQPWVQATLVERGTGFVCEHFRGEPPAQRLHRRRLAV